ncbi:HAD family hydrolase [Paenibacillus sp. MMS18-CY102]|uniref:HAD family hydrolase n=1 Tax=Paenibacillus sp. MMS18-CY102 TaxID=2682849 RepID=UPI0013651FB0|nr:HAD-IA family hydrolase [Paenibacillus sp. MMS18-CY102]MWC27949.1 HAD-IA family hydrolase [Paenibacillus sp. MMS18-CY102]
MTETKTTLPKPQLILDVGGVLLTNLSPGFWTELAETSIVPYETLRASYKQEVRDGLWSGAITELQFWQWAAKHIPELTPEDGRQLILKHLIRLPAVEQLQAWSRMADIHILSNHREEWLSPKLADIRQSITSWTVSSESGSFKPNMPIYEKAAAQLAGPGPILFVDDSRANLAQAHKLGWSTLWADPDSVWIESVVPLLNGMLRT